MTFLDILKDILVPMICTVLVPLVYIVFRDIRSLELNAVDMKKESEKLDEKINHLQGNYKQGIGHLNDELGRMNIDLVEMKTDIKELLRATYKRKDD